MSPSGFSDGSKYIYKLNELACLSHEPQGPLGLTLDSASNKLYHSTRVYGPLAQFFEEARD